MCLSLINYQQLFSWQPILLHGSISFRSISNCKKPPKPTLLEAAHRPPQPSKFQPPRRIPSPHSTPPESQWRRRRRLLRRRRRRLRRAAPCSTPPTSARSSRRPASPLTSSLSSGSTRPSAAPLEPYALAVSVPLDFFFFVIREIETSSWSEGVISSSRAGMCCRTPGAATWTPSRRSRRPRTRSFGRSSSRPRRRSPPPRSPRTTPLPSSLSDSR